jgi:hypothetical protein
MALLDQLTPVQFALVLVVGALLLYLLAVAPLWDLGARSLRRRRTRRHLAAERAESDRLLAARRASLDVAVRLGGPVGRMSRVSRHDARLGQHNGRSRA